jgi:NADP-dependent 3-hydroxy acid dehydrogenase YdfG
LSLVAEAVEEPAEDAAFAIRQPATIDVNEIIVRSTRQP